jgi:hypothetical protein
MRAIQIISRDVFDKVRSRFSNLQMGDETGAVTIDPSEARFFDFDFVVEGENLGRVSISLNDLGSLKVYYSQGITENLDDEIKKKWYSFLREMRFFAMRRLLRFDTRDIAKTNLDKNDFQQLAATQGPKEEEPMKTVNESKWSEQKSSKKTSRAVAGRTEVIVRHAKPVAEYAGARSQKKNIKAIFIQNAAGERFKYPFIHPAGAFAMAQHVDHGGVPHDPAGKAIINMSEEIAQLQEFQRKIQRASLHDDAMGITEKAVGRLQHLKEKVALLSKKHHYENWIAEFNEVEHDDQLMSELDAVTLEDYKSKFTQRTFEEELTQYFPLLHKIMKEANKVNLEDYVSEGHSTDLEMKLHQLATGADDMSIQKGLDGAYGPDVQKYLADKYNEISYEHGLHADDDFEEIEFRLEQELVNKYGDMDYSITDTDAEPKESMFKNKVEINGKEVDLGSLEVDGVDPRDYGDFADAYFSYAQFTDGTPLTDKELELLTDEHGDILNQMAHDSYIGGVDYITDYEREGVATANSPEEQFEEWAEAVEQGKLTDDQIETLKQEIGKLPMTDQGPQLELGADGQTAWQFFNNLGIDDKDFEEKLKAAAEVDDEMNAIEVFGKWAEENYPELLVALGMSGVEQSAEETTLPPTGAPGLATVHGTMENDEGNMGAGMMSKEDKHDPKDIVKEVAKIVKSFYNRDNPEVGPFRGNEGIAIDVEKTVSEKFGEAAGAQARELAEKFMEKLTVEWQERHGKMGAVDHDDGLARLKELMQKVKGKVENYHNKEVDENKKLNFNSRDYHYDQFEVFNPKSEEDENEPETIEVDVYYDVQGSYRSATQYDPPEAPEINIKAVLDSRTGEEIKDSSVWDEVDEKIANEMDRNRYGESISEMLRLSGLKK